MAPSPRWIRCLSASLIQSSNSQPSAENYVHEGIL